MFEFPDCPTCTADAPSIDLIDDYFAAPGCPGDIDGDGDTDVFDFGEFTSQFGGVIHQTAFDPAADLNKDGTIDVFDFAIFAAGFGCVP